MGRRTDPRTSVQHAIRPWLLTSCLVFAAACNLGGAGTTASVTIDVRCGSGADCPSGFTCTADSEHGPPITLCESTDSSASCPAGYETRAMYGQTFCKLPAPLTVSSPRASRASDGARRHRSGL